MQTIAILELEEGGLNVVVGGRDGATIRVVHSLRVPLTDLGRESLGSALRSIDRDVLQGVTGVHVVLGERRMQHFLATVPKLSVPDAIKFVVREALRVTGMQSPADTLVSTRLVRRLPHGRVVVGATAIARNVWEAMREAFTANDLQVLGLYSMEACHALAAASSDGGPVAVLECNGGRARFVLCDGQSPMQVRRFLIGGGGDGNATALAAQLTMELPRTFEWLRETNQPMPGTLVLGARVQVDDDVLPSLRGDDLKAVVRASSPVPVDADQAPPSIGVAMLLARLCDGQSLPSLLDEPTFSLPVPMSRIAGLAAMFVAGLAGSWSAVVDGAGWMQVRDAREEVAVEARELSGRLSAEGLPQTAHGPSGDDELLVGALSMRRPISKLLADVSNCADTELHVEDMKFASTDRIVITGIVQGDSRQDALKAIARFSRQLADIPYVLAGGDEEITEVPRLKNCFKFRLGMKWRNG